MNIQIMQLNAKNPFYFSLSKKISCVCAVLLGFSLPISTSLDSVLLILLFSSALIGWNSQYFNMVKENPVAKAALLLFCTLLIGCFYGITTPEKSFKVLTKYDDLILVALMLPIFSSPRIRLYGQYAFLAAMILTLFLSYLIWFGAFQHTTLFVDKLPDNPVVFKLHITHGILMGYAGFMFAVYAKYATGKKRWLLLAASVLAICNILLMTQGRTGYIVIIALITYLIFVLLPLRKTSLGLVLFVISLTSIYMTVPKIQTRVNLAIHEIQTWQPKQGNNDASSMGTRLDFYTNTINIIRKSPLFGFGTGGFELAYSKEVEGTAMKRWNNPHNQFLLFWAQIGVIGLFMFLYLLAVAWRAAALLPSNADKMLARGVLITIITGCIFNSLLLDHAEGLFFSWFLGLLFAGLPSNKQAD
jgi:O-antigen ligase